MAPSIVVEKLVLARRRRRRDSFLGRLVNGQPSADEQRLLEEEGRYAGFSEWRIGTVREELVERTAAGWSVWSRCDLDLSVTVARAPEALAARGVFAKLHADLFYGLGWASWAAYMQIDPPAAPWDRLGDDLDPYLRELADDARRRFAAEADAIGAAVEGDGWRGGSGRIECDPEAELPYRAAVEQGELKIAWRSPTVERALQFVGILDPLAVDLMTYFDWR